MQGLPDQNFTLIDLRLLQQLRLDLTRLYPKTAQLELLIRPTKIFKFSVAVATRQVS